MSNLETITVVLTGVTLAIAGLSPEDATGQSPVSVANSVQIAIPEGALLVNGERQRLPVPNRKLVKLLGKPTRVRTSKTKTRNTILTWDDLGIVAYLDPVTDKITAVELSLKKEAKAFSPNKTFAGRLTVTGVDVSLESTIAELNATSIDKPFKRQRDVPSIRERSWRAEYTSGIVWVTTAKKSGEGIERVAICAANLAPIWKRNE